MSRVEKINKILRQEVGTFDAESHTYLDAATMAKFVREINQLYKEKSNVKT